MNLRSIKDQELLAQTKDLVSKERHLLTQVLHHLKEIERRKLFSDLGYQSLFEYSVKELKFSEGQAGRRIQAMRLIKELPQLEDKIESGKLSLSNISQAQSFFRESKKSQTKGLSSQSKLELLEKLENKSARDGQRLILSMSPELKLTEEKTRPVGPSHTEVRFVMTNRLQEQLEELRSLMGPLGSSMGWAEMVEVMSQLSLEKLKEKRFGKRRSSEALKVRKPRETSSANISHEKSTSKPTPTSELANSRNPRYVSSALRYELWMRDKGQCVKCGSRRNLNVDHIRPVALGGSAEVGNLRLLCFHCNQRSSFKSFGRATDNFKRI